MKFVAMMRAGDVTVSDFGNGKGLLFFVDDLLIYLTNIY